LFERARHSYLSKFIPKDTSINCARRDTAICRRIESRLTEVYPCVEFRRGTAGSFTTQVLGAASELAQQSELMRSEVDTFLTEVKAVV